MVRDAHVRSADVVTSRLTTGPALQSPSDPPVKLTLPARSCWELIVWYHILMRHAPRPSFRPSPNKHVSQR